MTDKPEMVLVSRAWLDERHDVDYLISMGIVQEIPNPTVYTDPNYPDYAELEKRIVALEETTLRKANLVEFDNTFWGKKSAICAAWEELQDNLGLYRGRDLYRVIAEKVFGEENYTEEHRRYVKHVLFLRAYTEFYGKCIEEV